MDTKKEQKRRPGRTYYFPNTIVEFRGEAIEITSGGVCFQRDSNGSMRRLTALWLQRVGMFEVETLSGATCFVGVKNGTAVALETLEVGK